MLYPLTLVYLGFVSLVQAGTLHTFNSQRLTFYYEKVPTDICAANGGSPGNAGLPACAVDASETYAALNTNRVVAVNANLVSGTDRSLCGKKVIIKDATGKELTIPEGPFFVYDACPACRDGTKTDISVEAFVEASGGTCGIEPPKYNNPEGYTVIITDEQIYGAGSSGSGGGGAGGSPTTVGVQSIANPSTATAVASSTTTAVAVVGGVAQAPADKCPAKGQTRCVNGRNNICNAVGAPYPYLDWVDVGGACISKRSKQRFTE